MVPIYVPFSGAFCGDFTQDADGPSAAFDSGYSPGRGAAGAKS